MVATGLRYIGGRDGRSHDVDVTQLQSRKNHLSRKIQSSVKEPGVWG